MDTDDVAKTAAGADRHRNEVFDVETSTGNARPGIVAILPSDNPHDDDDDDDEGPSDPYVVARGSDEFTEQPSEQSSIDSKDTGMTKRSAWQMIYGSRDKALQKMNDARSKPSTGPQGAAANVAATDRRGLKSVISHVNTTYQQQRYLYKLTEADEEDSCSLSLSTHRSTEKVPSPHINTSSSELIVIDEDALEGSQEEPNPRRSAFEVEREESRWTPQVASPNPSPGAVRLGSGSDETSVSSGHQVSVLAEAETGIDSDLAATSWQVDGLAPANNRAESAGRTDPSNTNVLINAHLAPSENEIIQRAREELQEEMTRQLRDTMAQRITNDDGLQQAEVVPIDPSAINSFTSDDNDNPNDQDKLKKQAVPTRRRVYGAVSAVVVAVLLLFLAVTLGLFQNNNSDGSDAQADLPGTPSASTTSSPTSGQTQQPTPSPVLRASQTLPTSQPTGVPTTLPVFDQYLDLLWPYIEGEPSFTNRTVFDDPTTPQSQALTWLTATDSLQNMSSSAEQLPADIKQLLEKYSLAVIYYATGGQYWKRKYGFLSISTSACQWNDGGGNGVACNSEGMVSELNLEDNRMIGELPEELYLLTNLELLTLGDNLELGGTLSSSVGQLVWLSKLDVGNTKLYGTIPTEIGLLSNVAELFLYQTWMDGTVPSEIGQLSSLERIDLDRSRFTGQLPSEIGDIGSLLALIAFDTWLSGTIPTEYSKLTQLYYISIENNYIVGNLDPVFCRDDKLILPFEFWSSCGGSTAVDDLSLTTCSCCTHCCIGASNCREMRKRPDPCFSGECVSCGNDRYVPQCGQCTNRTVPSLGLDGADLSESSLTDAQLCQDGCAWNLTSQTCEVRTEYPLIAWEFR